MSIALTEIDVVFFSTSLLYRHCQEVDVSTEMFVLSSVDIF